MRTLITTITACALALAVPALAAGPSLDTEDKKTFYAIGLSIAQSLEPFALTADELELVKMGLGDGVARAAKVDMNQYRTKAQQIAQQRVAAGAEAEKKESAAFLEKMASEKGAEKTASGLVFIPMKAGSGMNPKATDNVKVHYHGTLRDGSVFDSSVQRGEPTSFPLNRVIPCWTEGLQKIKVGGKAKLGCPSSIAYGDRGMLPTIKPGAALVFEVELLAIEPPAAQK